MSKLGTPNTASRVRILLDTDLDVIAAGFDFDAMHHALSEASDKTFARGFDIFRMQPD